MSYLQKRHTYISISAQSGSPLILVLNLHGATQAISTRSTKDLCHILHYTCRGGGVAQWIGRRISDQGVPSSIPRRCTFRCGLEQVTFTLCLVLVKPRKRWTDDRLGQTVTRLEIMLCLMC